MSKRVKYDNEQLLRLTIANITSKDVLLNILMYTEVRAALNLTIATAGVPEYDNLRTIMKEESIWKYWFERDLFWQIQECSAFRSEDDDNNKPIAPSWIRMMAGFTNQDEETSLWDIDQNYGYAFNDKPVWKCVYLWYALAVSVIQFEYLERIKADNGLLALKYPRGTQINFIKLNTLQQLIPGKLSVEITFDSFFSRTNKLYKSLYSTTRLSRIKTYFETIFPSYHPKWTLPWTTLSTYQKDENNLLFNHSKTFLRLFRSNSR